MNGLEFITELRKESRYAALKVIMVTTETEMMQVVRALEAGANEYLMKPFTKEMIADKMTLLGVGAD
jgi:two-component system chemotaxis response regulator CheY